MESTERSHLDVGGLVVEVVRKDVKNLHLGVYPPSGRVRVAAPIAVSDEAVRLAVIGKLPWIRRQQETFKRQPRQSAREATTGESHYVFGQRRRLRVVADASRAHVVQATKTRLEIHVPPGSTPESRVAVLDRWQRQLLREAIEPLFEQWQKTLGVSPSSVGIKRMKTKWGSCNVASGSVWINSELAKKPIDCVEYIVVHELVHLLVPTHGERFIDLMDQHMPGWRNRRDQLNSMPLSHENWSY
jgi:hypothetical protein